MIKVTDDSGFLALVVPATYQSFVASNWSLEQLFEHFRQQMASRSLLIWGTGLEGFWRVDIRFAETRVRGFREVAGPIHVHGGSLLLTNYEKLTMAAQFEDIRLPERHSENQILSIPDGEHCCRIAQMFNPLNQEGAPGDGPDFAVAINKQVGVCEPWTAVPWFEP